MLRLTHSIFSGSEKRLSGERTREIFQFEFSVCELSFAFGCDPSVYLFIFLVPVCRKQYASIGGSFFFSRFFLGFC